MITVKIENLGRREAEELYKLLVGSEHINSFAIDINYLSLSYIEVSGGPQILKILSEYYNESR